MPPKHAESADRGVALAADLDTILAAAYAELAERLRAEPDPVARARAVTAFAKAGDRHFAEHLAEMRTDVVRELRHPSGYREGAVPAASWWEIGVAVGTNGNRAYQIADLPGDRSAPHAGRGAGKKGEGR